MDSKIFVGEWMLSGVAKGMIDVECYGDNLSCEYMDICKDGMLIRCTENPEDGYRSTLGTVEQISSSANMTMFPAVSVIGKHVTEDSRDSIVIYDKRSKNIVMEIGTNYVDDYYPCCILYYMPKNMTVTSMSEREFRDKCRKEIPKSFVRRPVH